MHVHTKGVPLIFPQKIERTELWSIDAAPNSVVVHISPLSEDGLGELEMGGKHSARDGVDEESDFTSHPYPEPPPLC
ncbi:hypothetical protein JTE90_028069 [Oedothorax gibbosus]|uniref:Uncharacterized protein n=1 Tax=Oedothorax gibbosus TaxID=931172 RepID=A0AAV6V892_9ARAC|nr:hypothetical protein JTE90_028069 [Oedothorax gibbosus]